MKRLVVLVLGFLVALGAPVPAAAQVSPTCGDGVVAVSERCDDGAFNGQPGGCNRECSGFVAKTIFPPQFSTLVPSPPGVIGVLVSQARDADACLPITPNDRDFDTLKNWLGPHDFVAGMKVRLAADTVFPRAVRLYDTGEQLSGTDRLLRFDMAQVEPLAEPVQPRAGDVIVVGLHAGVLSTCPCGTGGSMRTDQCSAGGLGGTPVCGLDALDAECVDFEVSDSGLSLAAGEPVSVGGRCMTSCSVAGQTMQCEEPGVVAPGPSVNPPGGYQDVSIGGTCSAKGGGVQVDHVCQSVMGSQVVTSCPGFCRSEDNCWALPAQVGAAGSPPDSCMFQINEDCFVDNLDTIQAAAAGTDEDLRNTLEHHFPADWAFCTSVGGRDRCREVNPNTGLLPGQRTNDPDDDARYECTVQGGLDSCMLCADRAGGGCFPTIRDARHRIADILEDISGLKPTSDDTKDRAMSMSELTWRTSTVPNARQLGNLVEDPVLLPTGELVMAATDISFPSRGVPFELTRSYRSGGAWHGAFGPGWVHSYEELIVPVGYLYNRQGMPSYCTSRPITMLCLLRYTPGGGGELYVYEPETVSYVPQPGAFGVIRVLTDVKQGFFGFELREPGGVVRSYDMSGVLSSIKDADGFGVELEWLVRSRATTTLQGAWLDQGSLRLGDEPFARRHSPLSGAAVPSSHWIPRMELAAVTDSYGRRFSFEYDTRFNHPNPGSDGPFNRRRLAGVSYNGERLVSYEYTELPLTNESYLTRVTRTGMSASLPAATPIVTEYEYQHDIFTGALAYPTQGIDKRLAGFYGGPLRRKVDGKVQAVTVAITSCAAAMGDPAVVAALPGPGLSACGVPPSFPSPAGARSLWPTIEVTIADNIVRVRRGGSTDADIEVESFFDPDPTSADFDRVIKQRYGAVPAVLATPQQEIGPASSNTCATASSSISLVDSGDLDPVGNPVLFTWRTAMPEAKIMQLSAGTSLPACITTSASGTIPNPDRQNLFARENRSIAVAAQIPIVAHEPFVAADTQAPAACLDLEATIALPLFHVRAPVGDRQDQDLAATPTIKRSSAACAQIAARHARDPFLNDMHDLAGIDTSELLDTRRKALEWDAALVCRWVQIVDRRGSVEEYGINFMGQVLVESRPSPAGSGLAVTRRRYNADGLIVEETRPDSSRTTMSYAGQARVPGNTLFRALPETITEHTPSGTPATVDVGGTPVTHTERTTRVSYETLFQQPSRITAPDGVETELFYDYHQLTPTDFFAKRLVGRFMRATGRTPTPSFLGRDIDGDGTGGVEASSGLVLSFVHDVDLGGGFRADVGERTLRDNCGTVIERRQTRRATDPEEDTDRVEHAYYKDVNDAEAGTLSLSACGCACGPLAMTKVYRTPSSTAAADIDSVRLTYDALGGVREETRNGDPATTVTTTRNGVGLVVEQRRPNGLRVKSTHDARGQVAQRIWEQESTAGGTPEILRSTTWAWGNHGGALGSCTDLSGTSPCAAFSGYALDVVTKARLGQPLPAAIDSASYAVTLLDAADLDVGGIDAAGGRTDRTRNPSGFVVNETTQAAPNPSMTTLYRYDVTGQLVREQRGTALERFFRYDGFGRLVGEQALAPLSLTSFTDGAGTITTSRYDLLDRPTTTIVRGDDGTGTRKVLSMMRTVRNSLGAEHYVNRLARTNLPTTVPALPGSGISDSDDWATEALRYDHALRATYYLPEGRTVPTTASYDGFGMSALNGATRSVAIHVDPAARTRTATTTLIAEGAGATAQSWKETLLFDGVGNTTKRTAVDLGNGVEQVWQTAYDAIGQTLEAAAPAGRSTRFDYDVAGRIIRRDEMQSGVTARTTTFAHDPLGRVIEETPAADAPAISVRHDLAGRAVLERSGLGEGIFATTWRYDTAGRLISQRKARGADSADPADPANPPRVTTLLYGANRTDPQKLLVDSVLVKQWVYDGLNRPVRAEDTNLADGTSAFKASRPWLRTALSFDTLGRVVTDENRGSFPSTSPTLANQMNVRLGKLTWTQPRNFLGPSALTTSSNEILEWGYGPRGTLGSITRRGQTGSRTIKITLGLEGGLWVHAEVSAGAGTPVVTKTRDALGMIQGSSLTSAGSSTPVFQEDVLRGPTGTIMAERRSGTLLGTRARGYAYDALRRLGELRIDAPSAMTRAAFLAQTNAVLGDESAGTAAIPAPDAIVAVRSTKADVITRVTPDHLGRSYLGDADPTIAGVPQTVVNGRTLQRDVRERVSTEGDLRFTYDVLDRLVLVQRGASEELRLAYDGLGRRRLERRLVTRPGGTFREDVALEYAGGNVIEERRVGTTTVSVPTLPMPTVPAPTVPMPPVLLAVTHAPGLDAPLAVSLGPTASFSKTFVIGTTARGDAAAALNADANAIEEEAALDAWGERETRNRSMSAPCVEGGEAAVNGINVSRPVAECAAGSDVLQRFGIAGARMHARTKLVDLRNRVYATHLRAFLTKDPLGNHDSNGLWNYVAGDPINLRDPWGLENAGPGICDDFDGVCPVESAPEPPSEPAPAPAPASAPRGCDAECNRRRQEGQLERAGARVPAGVDDYAGGDPAPSSPGGCATCQGVGGWPAQPPSPARLAPPGPGMGDVKELGHKTNEQVNLGFEWGSGLDLKFFLGDLLCTQGIASGGFCAGLAAGAMAHTATAEQLASLLAAALQPYRPGSQHTKAGRAFQKHARGSRSPDSPFPPPTGNPAAQNATGEAQIKEILEKGTRTELLRGGVKYLLPDGRGARWNSDGSGSFDFETFTDNTPPRD